MIILDAFIPHKIKSGNAFTSGRGAMWVKKKYREKWGELLRLKCGPGPWATYKQLLLLSPPPCKIYGQYVRYMDKGDRPFDQANIEKGIKLIMDCLKPVIAHEKRYKKTGRVVPRILGLGWIVDDSPQWHEYECRQVKEPGKVGLRIILSTEKI